MGPGTLTSAGQAGKPEKSQSLTKHLVITAWPSRHMKSIITVSKFRRVLWVGFWLFCKGTSKPGVLGWRRWLEAATCPRASQGLLGTVVGQDWGSSFPSLFLEWQGPRRGGFRDLLPITKRQPPMTPAKGSYFLSLRPSTQRM